jgi:hypothetical protein
VEFGYVARTEIGVVDVDVPALVLVVLQSFVCRLPAFVSSR